MANPAESEVQNLLPVQAYFDAQNNFVTFIGQNQPFYAIPDPDQSGLHITNSTIDSSIIGGTTPAVGYFTSGYVSIAPTTPTGIANKQYVDYFAAGLSWKQPVKAASLANIASLSGFQTIDSVPLTDGDRILVKDQSLSKNNGIYVVRSGAWEYAVGADDWQEYVGAIVFVEEGSQAYSAWYSLAQEGGTLGVTALDWANFSVSSTYSAGTGLTLSAGVFSITNTGVTNATYGSASKTVTLAINAQGQATSASQQDIAIAATQITSGTLDSARLSGSYSGITGVGTLGNLTVTNTISGSINGNAATATTAGSATTATTATNIAGGAAGSVPYQTASGATTFLAAATNGQVLTLASGVPSWATPTSGTVTSVSGTGTVNGLTLTGTVTTSGSLTLGGTLDLSSPPAIGGTTSNSGAFTTLTASTSVTTPIVQATNSAGLALKNASGTTQMSMGAGGGDNLAINVSANLNGTNAQIDISPTGTGHVHLNPTGSGSVQIAPTSAGTIDNLAIGGTTPLAGTFTTLRVNSTLSLAGSTGTSGYVLTSNGASAPTWSALPASSISITDNTSSGSTFYPALSAVTTGSITGATTSSTKLSFVPSTGVLTATGFNGTHTGTWNGTAIAVGYGGLGITTTPANGQIPIGNGTNYTAATLTAGSGITITNSSGGITISTGTASSYTVESLVIAGGGGGGKVIGGGGGAGGLVYTASTGVNTSTGYTITVGAAGAGAVNGGAAATNGGNSLFSTFVTSIGGGASGDGGNGAVGGSGGAPSYGATYYGGIGTNGQGYWAGNTYVDNGNTAGGGGGAMACGRDTASGNSGMGGNGSNAYSVWATATTTGVSGYYAGGGGGGARSGSAGSGQGGLGGGGNGNSGGAGSAATANTGSGGGGAGFNGSFFSGGNGGSGIVIIRYAGSQRGTGGTVVTTGGYTYHTFTSSGTYTA